MFHVSRLKKYLRFILQMPNSGTAAVLLIQVHLKIKNYLCRRDNNFIAKREKLAVFILKAIG